MFTIRHLLKAFSKVSSSKQAGVYLLVVFLVGISSNGYSQFTRHIIQLRDKHGTPYTLQDARPHLSAKAIERRTRFNINLDSTDLPISADYLDSIRKVPGATILSVS